MPSAKALSLSPQTASAAPLEHVTFEAKNGTKPYTFSIASNGSGGATVDAKTGDYQAGPTGPATDVVRVTDASGQSVVANVTVGPKLTVSPTLTLAAPGGQVALTATGGKPPYTAQAVTNASGGSFGGTDGLTWTVGTAGAGTDVLEVTDAVGATARSQVHVGQGLALLPTRDPTVAPLETLAFVATGGQPPYTFSVKNAQSGAAGRTQTDPPLIGQSGIYQAGPVGNKTDTLEVTDANHETATADVTVTAALEARLASTDIQPGVPDQVLASGGAPPYVFRIADKGNASGGTVDATGLYTPGWSYGVRDTLEIEDTAGAIVTLQAPPVGPVTLPVTADGTVVSGGVSGQETFLAHTGPAKRLLTSFTMQPGRAPLVHTYAGLWATSLLWRPGQQLGTTFSEDVLALDDRKNLDELRTGLDGTFQMVLGLGLNPPIESFDILGPANGAFTVFTESPACSGLDGQPWPVGGLPDVPTCHQMPAGWSYDAPWRLALVDANSDPDVVWTHGNVMEVAYGPTFTTSQSFQLPGPVVRGVRPVVGPLTKGANTGGPEAVLTLVTLTDGTTAASGVYDGQVVPGIRLAPADQPQPDRLLANVAYFGDASSFVTWSSYDGGPITSFARDAGGIWRANSSATMLPPGLWDEGSIGDLNADGENDLVLYGGLADRTVILWGDGDGAFGARPRVGPLTYPLVADLDGDGVDDVVATDADSLAILSGKDHGLAWMQTLPFGASYPCMVADITGDGSKDIVYVVPGDGIWVLSRDATGRFSKRSQPRHPKNGALPDAVDCSPVDLGGSAPGPDVLVYGYDPTNGLPTPGVIVRDTGSLSSVAVPPPCKTGGPFDYGDLEPYDANGDGVTDLVAICGDSVSGDVELWTSLGSTSGASGPSFGGWTQIWVNNATIGDEGYVFGEWGPDVGFLDWNDYSQAASLLIVSGQQVTAQPLPDGTSTGALGDLDGDGHVDAILDTRAGISVLLDAESSSTIGAPVPGVRGEVRGTAVLAPGALPDVLVQSGNDLVILKNDGTGHLQ